MLQLYYCLVSACYLLPSDDDMEDDMEDDCGPLVVTFRTVCRDGQILVCSASEDEVSSVCSDFMDLDSDDDDDDDDDNDKEVETIVISSGSECEEDTKVELRRKTRRLSNQFKKEETKEEIKEEEDVKEELKEEDIKEKEVSIAEYASEEFVQTLPFPPHKCTNVDIDICVGKLLAKEYGRKRTIRILDKESILKLQAQSYALEEFSSVSNEVVIDAPCERPIEHIPLSNCCNTKREVTRNVSKQMLSFKQPSYPYSSR